MILVRAVLVLTLAVRMTSLTITIITRRVVMVVRLISNHPV